jgi:hypothetical protein
MEEQLLAEQRLVESKREQMRRRPYILVGVIVSWILSLLRPLPYPSRYATLVDRIHLLLHHFHFPIAFVPRQRA